MINLGLYLKHSSDVHKNVVSTNRVTKVRQGAGASLMIWANEPIPNLRDYERESVDASYHYIIPSMLVVDCIIEGYAPTALPVAEVYPATPIVPVAAALQDLFQRRIIGSKMLDKLISIADDQHMMGDIRQFLSEMTMSKWNEYSGAMGRFFPTLRAVYSYFNLELAQ